MSWLSVSWKPHYALRHHNVYQITILLSTTTFPHLNSLYCNLITYSLLLNCNTSLTHQKQYQFGYQCYLIICYVQGCTGIPKIHRSSQKSMCQKADMKQASHNPYWVPTNIRYHRIKFSSPHKLVHWICAPECTYQQSQLYMCRSVFLKRTWLHISILKHDINTAKSQNI